MPHIDDDLTLSEQIDNAFGDLMYKKDVLKWAQQAVNRAQQRYDNLCDKAEEGEE